jgi:hypothetical protein
MMMTMREKGYSDQAIADRMMKEGRKRYVLPTSTQSHKVLPTGSIHLHLTPIAYLPLTSHPPL